MLWLDGVYGPRADRKPRLRRTRAPTSAQLTQLADTIARRVCRHLAKRGWLEGEADSAFLTNNAGGDDGLDALRLSSITYRIATGAQAGRKVATLQTLPGDAGSLDGEVGKVGVFSLHAGVAAEAHESRKLETLCRYITRPAISEQRLSISPQGRVRYALKTPWRNGTTHVELLRASCPSRCAPACGCSNSLQANLSSRWTSSPSWRRWCRRHARNSRPAFLARARRLTRTPITARRRKGVDR